MRRHLMTSTDGGQKANLDLSMLRAQRISGARTTGGTAPTRLMRVGAGEVKAVGTAGEARRVEIVVRAP